MKALLDDAADRALRYLEALHTRPVAPSPEAIAALRSLEGPLPESGESPHAVVAQLDEVVSPATIASAGPRYFGFVTGGTLPAALGASWLAGAWDQNAFSVASSPGGAAVERVALGWLLEVLDLPRDGAGAFVTGATMANFTALGAARRSVLADVGWDADRDGLFGAPEVMVVVSEEAHATLHKALGLLGFGRERVTRIPVDDQGRMRSDALGPIHKPAIVCLQAGNVNTGAFDPASIIDAAHAADAWVHVDGAFGLWARAAPERAHLAAGLERADSWAVDAHKWLNVPYDSGLAFVRDSDALRGAMSVRGAYLVHAQARDPFDFTPESSRRMRAVEIWAALRALGRSGVADLVERCCRHATRFADELAAAGHRVLNEVDLNQVLVSFGDSETTERTIAAIQAEGTCWCGGTVWQGQSAMRISVSSWATTDADVEKSLEAMLRVAAAERERTRPPVSVT